MKKYKITTPYMFGGLFMIRNKKERLKGLFYIYDKHVVQLIDLKYIYHKIPENELSEYYTNIRPNPTYREQQRILKGYFYNHYNDFETKPI